jgi:hypothetical protein
MNEAEIYKVIGRAVSKAVEDTVPPTVERFVNGKIDKIDKRIETLAGKFDDHVVEYREGKEITHKFMEEMLPIREGVHTMQGLIKFLRWIGIPSFVAFISWLFLGRL